MKLALSFKALLLLIFFPVFSFCQSAKQLAASGIEKSKNKNYEGAIED
jgi:hypothetical protein